MKNLIIFLLVAACFSMFAQTTSSIKADITAMKQNVPEGWKTAQEIGYELNEDTQLVLYALELAAVPYQDIEVTEGYYQTFFNLPSDSTYLVTVAATEISIAEINFLPESNLQLDEEVTLKMSNIVKDEIGILTGTDNFEIPAGYYTYNVLLSSTAQNSRSNFNLQVYRDGQLWKEYYSGDFTGQVGENITGINFPFAVEAETSENIKFKIVQLKDGGKVDVIDPAFVIIKKYESRNIQGKLQVSERN